MGRNKRSRPKRTSPYQQGNMFACGSTRSGKSVAKVNDVVAAASKRDVAVVVCDPHPNSLAWNSFIQLMARGHGGRIIYDQLTNFNRVPAYQFLAASKARNSLRRDSLNEQTAVQFADILCRRGGRGTLSSTPLTEEWTMKACRLMLNQRSPLPASDMRFAFQPRHNVQRRLIAGCTDPVTKFEFEQIASGKIKRGVYSSAARLIESVCGSPAFRARCGQSFDIAGFLDDAGILLVEGGEDGVAPEVAQTIMATTVMKVINYVRQRAKPFPRVLLVLDEATNANLVSSHETRAMAECQKMGLDIHVLVQLLDFPSADICNGVLSNSIRHEWFYNANPNVIRKAVDDLGFSFESDKGSLIRSLKVGERWVKHRGRQRERVWREQVEMMANPWVFPRLAYKKAKKLLHQIRQRPEYQSPIEQAVVTSNEEAPRLPEPGASAAGNMQRLLGGPFDRPPAGDDVDDANDHVSDADDHGDENANDHPNDGAEKGDA